MKQEEIKRLRKAYQYQKLAVQSLLPEKTVKHLEVITNEIKTMILEGVADCLSGTITGNETQKYSSQGWSTAEKEEPAAKIKKETTQHKILPQEAASLSQEAEGTKPDKFPVQPEQNIQNERHSDKVRKISIQ